jgi:hypothetical protein
MYLMRTVKNRRGADFLYRIEVVGKGYKLNTNTKPSKEKEFVDLIQHCLYGNRISIVKVRVENWFEDNLYVYCTVVSE